MHSIIFLKYLSHGKRPVIPHFRASATHVILIFTNFELKKMKRSLFLMKHSDNYFLKMANSKQNYFFFFYQKRRNFDSKDVNFSRKKEQQQIEAKDIYNLT